MELYKTYCTKRGREVHGCYCDNCDPHVEVKLLSIKELREQFDGKYKLTSPIVKGNLWEGYVQCAKANNMLKDGE